MQGAITKTSDNEYINITIQPISTSAAPQQMRYREDLSQPIIRNPSEYYFALVKMEIPTDTIPLMIFPTDITQANVNQSYVVIGINQGGTFSTGVPVGGTNYFQNVIYNPVNNFSPPQAVGPISDETSYNKYYWIYTITPFLEMINTALAAACTAAGILLVNTPYYTWDSSTQLISLRNVTTAFLAGNNTIVMNEYCTNYLNSFELYFENSIYSQNNGELSYHDFRILPRNQTSPYVITQDYTTISLWFDLRKIVVISSSLPVNSEMTPSGSNPTQSGGNANYSNIITDFTPILQNSADLQELVVYIPAEYRLIDFIGQTPLTKLDLSFFWQDKFGRQIPIEMSAYQTATVKLGFFKKSLYQNNPALWK